MEAGCIFFWKVLSYSCAFGMKQTPDAGMQFLRTFCSNRVYINQTVIIAFTLRTWLTWKQSDKCMLIICAYLALLSHRWAKWKKIIGAGFKMKDLGSLQHILGINVQPGTDSESGSLYRTDSQKGLVRTSENQWPHQQWWTSSFVKNDGSKSANQTLYKAMRGSLR